MVKKSSTASAAAAASSKPRFAYGTRKINKCKICKKRSTGTEIHHIISQTRRPDLKYNKSNQIELCKACHNETTASLVYARLSGKKLTTRHGICYKCKKPGHWADECGKRKPKPTRRRKPKKTKPKTLSSAQKKKTTTRKYKKQ